MSKGRSRILVVDNLEDAADTLAMLLRIWGHDAEVCYDGPSAVRAALAQPPQVVLLDVGMPGMDGFAVARCLRKLPELDNTVIVGITGYGDKAHRATGAAAGFDHYLLKPVEPDHLQQLLASITTERRVFVVPEGGEHGHPALAFGGSGRRGPLIALASEPPGLSRRKHVIDDSRHPICL